MRGALVEVGQHMVLTSRMPYRRFLDMETTPRRTATARTASRDAAATSDRADTAMFLTVMALLLVGVAIHWALAVAIPLLIVWVVRGAVEASRVRTAEETRRRAHMEDVRATFSMSRTGDYPLDETPAPLHCR